MVIKMGSLSDALAQAVAQIEAKVNDALADEVATAVRKDEREAIIDKVYSAYNPVKYRRRAYYGGMLDPGNMEATVVGGVLTVTNETPPAEGEGYTTGKYLDRLIEGGHGNGGYYDFPGRGAYMKARPFTATTIDMLRSDKSHVAALKAGLQKRGLKVE